MDHPQKLEDVEHFFLDPLLGDRTLMPPVVSIVCGNIRKTLSVLGYEDLSTSQGREWYEYNDTLVTLVRRFQKDNNHQFHDGLFGRGTRRLLISKTIEVRKERVFYRMHDPQEDIDSFLVTQEISHQQHLLSIYRSNRRELEVQAAKFGSMHIPLPLKNQLEEARQLVRDTDQKIEDLRQVLIANRKP